MKKATIIGACGFGGLGLITIILQHPGMEISQLIDRTNIGQPISHVFPNLKGHCDITVQSNENINYSDVDIVFFSTPDRAGMTLIRDFHEKNIPVIDFSGDFRFASTEDYTVYANNKGMETEHLAKEMLGNAVYGLPELYRDKIRNARIIGNPGCFAISMILGLLPAVHHKIIDTRSIICDGKTGVSGAGKNPGEANYYPQRYENMNTYREGKHQHLVEVENVLNSLHNDNIKIFFVPQVVPMSRGILTTMYCDIAPGYDTEKVLTLYREFYRDSHFVVVRESSLNTTNVRGSNRCDVRAMVDSRTGKLFITSAIDNLMKGQSGNAIQNANIMLGFDEITGLDIPAFFP
ncbi:MAG TPA: N-acetyl-gamma-glutamyl-phosphate reductase [Spirochaetota bacterium]|nr:N-acetyl-gamma-glutamyl-phosphate reductase [Spirochaetota bacterium]